MYKNAEGEISHLRLSLTVLPQIEVMPISFATDMASILWGLGFIYPLLLINAEADILLLWLPAYT